MTVKELREQLDRHKDDQPVLLKEWQEPNHKGDSTARALVGIEDCNDNESQDAPVILLSGATILSWIDE
jgi:hypothetical protein